MKFAINPAQFLTLLRPAIEVATKDVDRDCFTEDYLTLQANESSLQVKANGGRASLVVEIPAKQICTLSYRCYQPGTATVGAIHLMWQMRSFGKQSLVMVEIVDGLLQLSHEGPSRSCSTLPLVRHPVDLPNTFSKHCQTARVDRKAFLAGLRNLRNMTSRGGVLAVRAGQNELQLAAGAAEQFAILQIVQKNIVQEGKSINFLLPKNYIEHIITTLARAECPSVSVQIGHATLKSPTAKHICIVCGSFKLMLSSDMPDSPYPEWDDILNHPYEYQICSNLQDWHEPLLGIRAASQREPQDYSMPIVQVTADVRRGYWHLSIDHNGLGSERSVPFCLGTNQSPASVSHGHSINFTCKAQYLLELDEYGDPSDTVIMAVDGTSTENNASPGAGRFLCITYPPIAQDTFELERRRFIVIRPHTRSMQHD